MCFSKVLNTPNWETQTLTKSKNPSFSSTSHFCHILDLKYRQFRIDIVKVSLVKTEFVCIVLFLRRVSCGKLARVNLQRNKAMVSVFQEEFRNFRFRKYRNNRAKQLLLWRSMVTLTCRPLPPTLLPLSTLSLQDGRLSGKLVSSEDALFAETVVGVAVVIVAVIEAVLLTEAAGWDIKNQTKNFTLH